MLTQARRNQGRETELIEITDLYVNFQKKCFYNLKLFLKISPSTLKI